MVEKLLSEDQLRSLFDFMKSPVRYEIIRWLPQRVLLDVIQFLNRDMYHQRVPRVLNRVLLYNAKFPSQLQFIDMIRTANLETHQFKQIVF